MGATWVTHEEYGHTNAWVASAEGVTFSNAVLPAALLAVRGSDSTSSSRRLLGTFRAGR